MESNYIIYPCGWWDPCPHFCKCAYWDMFGNNLRDHDRICLVPRQPEDLTIIHHVRDLRLDYIYGEGIVQFVGKWGGEDFSDDQYGPLHVSQIISARQFRKMLPLAQYFLKHTLPKLHALRLNSRILKSLRFCDITRLSRVNARTKTYCHQLSDATLVRSMSRMVVNRFSHTHPDRQWQHQGKLYWRVFDSAWCTKSDKDTGRGPAGSWQRYTDPASSRCFWWRTDDDWGWECDCGSWEAMGATSTESFSLYSAAAVGFRGQCKLVQSSSNFH